MERTTYLALTSVSLAEVVATKIDVWLSLLNDIRKANTPKAILVSGVLALTPVVSFAQTGNVGIGTSSPGNKLTVEGGTSATVVGAATDNKLLMLRNNQGGSVVNAMQTTSGATTFDFWYGINSAQGSLGFFCNEGSGNKEWLTYNFTDNRVVFGLATTNIGIGTNAPTSTLSVNGTADKVGGGMWGTFSDARMKKNIAAYTKGLDEILKIRTVTFQYNGKGGYGDDGKTYVGVLAQEIEKVLPGTVSQIKTTDFKDQRKFDPSEITYALINAIREQQTQIEALKKQNADLRTDLAQMASLKDQLNLLKASVEKMSGSEPRSLAK